MKRHRSNEEILPTSSGSNKKEEKSCGTCGASSLLLWVIRGGGGGRKNKNFNCVVVGLLVALLLFLIILRGDVTTKQIGVAVATRTKTACPNYNNSTMSVYHESNFKDVDQFLETIDAQPQRDRCLTKATSSSSCKCMNPVRPNPPNTQQWNKTWQVAFERNLQLTRDYHNNNNNNNKQLDVLLLGDSITEAWHGTGMATFKGKYKDNAQVYRELFHNEKASSLLRGLALGIAGDRCSQLLYRLQLGEMLGLLPKVVWLLIGTNDFGHESCHPDQIVAGSIRIVQEILSLLSSQQKTTVVIQALLPHGHKNTGVVHNWHVYSEINQRLSCYAQRTPNVEFVDLTRLFLASTTATANHHDGTKQTTPVIIHSVNKTMLPDGLHPSGRIAAEIWGKEIVRTVQEIIASSS